MDQVENTNNVSQSIHNEEENVATDTEYINEGEDMDAEDISEEEDVNKKNESQDASVKVSEQQSLKEIYSKLKRDFNVYMARPLYKTSQITKCICTFNESKIVSIPYEWNQYRRDNKMCDAKIICSDGGEYDVHKVVVGAVSPYFMTAFSGSANVTLQIKSCILELILNYAYIGKCEINSSDVQALYLAADMLRINGIIKECREFLIKNLTPDNCLEILKLAINDTELRDKVQRYIQRRFKDIVKVSDEFVNLSDTELFNILTDDKLGVDEITVYESIIEWVNHDLQKREKYLQKLLHCPRYTLMDPKSLDVVMENPLVNKYCSVLNRVERTSEIERMRIPYDIMFIFGGYIGRQPQTAVMSYESRTKKFYQLHIPKLPRPTGYFGVCVIDHIIYIAGGCSPVKNNKNLDSFNTITCEWQELACMYEERCYVSVCSLDGKIYAIGGFNTDGKLSSAERYDPVKNQWEIIRDMHKARSDASCAVYNNKIYVVGGYNGKVVLQSSEMYNPKTDLWTLIEHVLSLPRSGLSVVALNGRIYALGGFDGYRRRKEVEYFDLRDQTQGWKSVESMKSVRSNFGCAVLEGKIYVIGGYDGYTKMQSVECYDIEKNTWEETEERLPNNQSACSACILSGLQNRDQYIREGAYVNTAAEEKN